MKKILHGTHFQNCKYVICLNFWVHFMALVPFLYIFIDGKAHKYLYCHKISITKQQGAVVWDITK